MARTYDLDSLIRVTATWSDTAGSAIDPTTVTLYIKSPASTLTTLVYGVDTDLVKDTTGVYHADINVTESGKYYYRFKGTGAAQASSEYWFSVKGVQAST